MLTVGIIIILIRNIGDSGVRVRCLSQSHILSRSFHVDPSIYFLFMDSSSGVSHSNSQDVPFRNFRLILMVCWFGRYIMEFK